MKNFSSGLLPLVYAGSSGNEDSALCGQGALKGFDVKGKVVLCGRGGTSKGFEVLRAGGAAMILMNDESNGYSTIADAHVLPEAHVSHAAGLNIKAYINSTTSPGAKILFKGTVNGNSLAPSVASFSSRGPNTASPGILRPDIVGPGVTILGASPFPIDENTNTKAFFNIASGTSMCGLGYTDAQVSLIVHGPTNYSLRIPDAELNYPSFSVTLGPTQTFTRAITNIGKANSSYSAMVVAPKGVYATAKPNKLSFSKVNQIATYFMTFSRSNGTGKKALSKVNQIAK